MKLKEKEPRCSDRSKRDFGRAIKLILLFFIALGICSSVGFSADKNEKEPPAEKKSSFIFLPILYYTPETRWAGGVGGLFTFRPSGSQEKSRPSALTFAAITTQNRQFILNLKPELYFKNGSTIIISYLDLKKFPDKFYGIGNNSPNEAEESYTLQQISLELSIHKKLWTAKNTYAGLLYNFDHYKFLELEPDGQLASGMIPGTRGGIASGYGAVFKWDSRDNIFFPTVGNFIQLSASMYASVFGSDYDYIHLKTDMRTYIPLFRTHVLAFQGLFREVSGTIPFMALPNMGGESVMRGYYGARYRDKILTAVQAEYRFPVWWRFGLVGFAGLGQVADRLSHLKPGEFKYSAGWGIRFKISPKEGANIRLDFGYGKNSSGIYFTAGEAF